MRRRSDPTKRLLDVRSSRSRAELIAALDDPSPEVARAAVAGLAQLGGTRPARALQERLLTADPSVVPDIAVALARLGDPAAADLAIAGLSQQPYTRRLAAARALAVLADTRAIEALHAALRDPVAGVRVAVLASLAELGASERTANECTQLLADPDTHVRVAAVRPSRGPRGDRAGCSPPQRAIRIDWFVRKLHSISVRSRRARRASSSATPISEYERRPRAEPDHDRSGRSPCCSSTIRATRYVAPRRARSAISVKSVSQTCCCRRSRTATPSSAPRLYGALSAC
jgi:HEAT repeats